MSSPRVTWLVLTPRDAIHIGDGRQFTAGDGTTAETVHPWPSTIAGAVGAAYGMEPLDVRGPVLALQDGDAWEPYLPVPADLAWSGPGDTVIRLSPGPSGEVATDLGDGLTLLRPTAGDVSARPLRGLLPAAVMTDYLDGTLVGGARRAQADITEAPGADWPASPGRFPGGRLLAYVATPSPRRPDSRKRKLTAGSGPVPRVTTGSASRNSSGKSASCGGPMRS